MDEPWARWPDRNLHWDLLVDRKAVLSLSRRRQLFLDWRDGYRGVHHLSWLLWQAAHPEQRDRGRGKYGRHVLWTPVHSHLRHGPRCNLWAVRVQLSQGDARGLQPI